MDDEIAAKTKKHSNVMIVRVRPTQIAVAVLALFLVFWIVQSGLGVANEAESEISSSGWGFHVGVVTILFGILFLALGIPILINLLLKLSEQLLKQDENSIYNPGSSEMRPVRVVVVRILVILITIIMLAWASYTGYRLATVPRRNDKYYPLIFPIGVVTIAFGTVYIIIGLALIADLALGLIVQFLLKKRKATIAQQDPNTEDKSFV